MARLCFHCVSAYAVLLCLLSIALKGSLALAEELPYPRIFFLEHRGSPAGEPDDRISSAHTFANGTTRTQEIYRVPGKLYITPESIAIDKEAGIGFYSHQSYGQGEIVRLNLNGTDVKTIVPLDKTGFSQYTPDNLELDSTSNPKKLYWSTRGPTYGIFRANLDGTNRELVVETAKQGCAQQGKGRIGRCGRITGITIDHADGFIYWGQMDVSGTELGSIHRAPLKASPRGGRSDVQLVLKDQPNPAQLQLAGGILYVADAGQGFDMLVPGAATSTLTRFAVGKNLGSANAKAEVLAQAQAGSTSFWSSLAVDAEKGHLYFGDSVRGKLSRSGLDGKNVEVLLSNVPQIGYLQFVK